MLQTVCVYCGALLGKDPAAKAAAEQLGTELAQRGIHLVYGGGSTGLMGMLARSVLQAGGEVTGIIPQALLEREIGFIEATELIVTNTMRERKAMMDERSDMFIVLPGGFGTLEELMETLTLRLLGYHSKPIIMINVQGYYDPLINFFVHAVAQGYVWENHKELYYVVNTVDEAIALIDSF